MPTLPGALRIGLAFALLVVVALSSTTRHSDAWIPLGPAGVVNYGVSKHQGFEKCSAPDAGTMQAWWDRSPFYDIGAYIGGPTRYCTQRNLTSSWVNTVHNQGWSFYLIWAGGQARCLSSAEPIPASIGQAVLRGAADASTAIQTAAAYGFTGYNVYYLDLESYDTSNPACGEQYVEAYVSGWGGRMVYLNADPDVYSTGCPLSHFATIQYGPHAIWEADWNNDPDVWGLYCMPDYYWIYDQRIHQWNHDLHPPPQWNVPDLDYDPDCEDGDVTPGSYNGVEETICTHE
jgi:hypothetical protein